MTTPRPGAVATLADVAARLINRCSITTPDSTDHEMVKVRAALIVELQQALVGAYPDPRDHTMDLRNALMRKVRAQ